MISVKCSDKKAPNIFGAFKIVLFHAVHYLQIFLYHFHALFDADLGSVETQVVASRVVPLVICVIPVVCRSFLVYPVDPSDGLVSVAAVILDGILDQVVLVCMDEDSYHVGMILKDEVSASSYDDC